MNLKITSLPGTSTILAGSIAGIKAAQAVENALRSAIASNGLRPEQAPIVFLDFADVETVAASFLREFTAPFFGGPNRTGSLNSNLSPAFIGIGSGDLKTELNDFLAGEVIGDPNFGAA